QCRAAGVDLGDLAAEEPGKISQVAPVVEQRAATGTGPGGERPAHALAAPVVGLTQPDVGEPTDDVAGQQLLALLAGPLERSWWLTHSTTRASEQAAIISSARSRSRAMGFSTRTCTPAAAAARVAGWCTTVGAAMLTTSMPPSANIVW